MYNADLSNSASFAHSAAAGKAHAFCYNIFLFYSYVDGLESSRSRDFMSNRASDVPRSLAWSCFNFFTFRVIAPRDFAPNGRTDVHVSPKMCQPP